MIVGWLEHAQNIRDDRFECAARHFKVAGLRMGIRNDLHMVVAPYLSRRRRRKTAP
jgi:hypothetical protein